MCDAIGRGYIPECYRALNIVARKDDRLSEVNMNTDIRLRHGHRAIVLLWTTAVRSALMGDMNGVSSATNSPEHSLLHGAIYVILCLP